ncbi:hypothetical protein FRC14_005817, partial [Serendipita sp. 396]
INASGHKYGLTYPGLGWLVIKDENLLPKDLIFELHYLGTAQSSFTLNFSRPAAPVLAQMYRFLTLGRQGYTEIVKVDLANARMLSRALEMSYFTLLSNIHRPVDSSLATSVSTAVSRDKEDPKYYVKGLPVVAFRLSDKFKEEFPYVRQRWIQQLLRSKGWIVPNYNAPKAAEQIEMLRVVIRDTMSADLVGRLVSDILEVTESLMEKDSDNTLIMALAEAPKKGIAPGPAPPDPAVETSKNHTAQHRGAPSSRHHDKHHKHGKTGGRVIPGSHLEHPGKHGSDGNRLESKAGIHKSEQDDGPGQVGFGRPC